MDVAAYQRQPANSDEFLDQRARLSDVCWRGKGGVPGFKLGVDSEVMIGRLPS